MLTVKSEVFFFLCLKICIIWSFKRIKLSLSIASKKAPWPWWCSRATLESSLWSPSTCYQPHRLHLDESQSVYSLFKRQPTAPLRSWHSFKCVSTSFLHTYCSRFLWLVLNMRSRQALGMTLHFRLWLRSSLPNLKLWLLSLTFNSMIRNWLLAKLFELLLLVQNLYHNASSGPRNGRIKPQMDQKVISTKVKWGWSLCFRPPTPHPHTP